MATYESASFSKASWSSVNGTDAEYRAWGQACQNAIAQHLTLVSSTTNWTTATFPATGNTWESQAIYRFNDGLAEIYIKFEFGRSNTMHSTYGGQWGLRVTVATDATFSQTSSSHYLGDGYNVACSDMMWLSSFGDGCFVLTSTTSTAHSSFTPAIVVVERSRDYDGAPNSNAFICLISGVSLNGSASSPQSYSQKRIVFSPFAVNNSGSSVSYIDPTDATLYGNIDTAAPVAWGSTDGHLYQMRSLLAVKQTTVPQFSDVAVTRQGVDHLYRTTYFSPSNFIDASRIIFRWE